MPNQEELHSRSLSSAQESDAAIAKIEGQESFKLAFTDREFMMQDELRAVRLQLEYLKPQLILDKHNIDATLVVFGSARFLPPEQAQYELNIAKKEYDKNPDDARLTELLKQAELAVKNSRYYQLAQQFSYIATEHSRCNPDENLVVVSGGGPGVMEAANRGALEAGGKSIGLNIVLPKEQRPNPYITPEYCFQFHYFAIRKMHFLQRARALVALPGGFGTLDELFETLTLVQTKKARPVPIVLVGSEFWSRAINFDVLVEYGTIHQDDLKLFSIVDTAEEAWRAICHYYDLKNPSE